MTCISGYFGTIFSGSRVKIEGIRLGTHFKIADVYRTHIYDDWTSFIYSRMIPIVGIPPHFLIFIISVSDSSRSITVVLITVFHIVAALSIQKVG